MTTDETDSGQNIDVLNENLAKIEELSQRLIAALANKPKHDKGLEGPGQEFYMKSAAAYMNQMVANPSKLIEQQVSFWGKSLENFIEAQNALAQGVIEMPADTGPKDRRFANPLWNTHPYFRSVKQQYLMNSDAIETAVADMEGLDEGDRKRAAYFSRQIIDLFSPSNFLGTNPDALTRAVETDGQSLVDGLENLVRDIEANDGELMVTLADKNAFKVGENIATTPGSVVFRNRMFELIQYTPTTDKVHEIPLVIFPPWINKFYIMDLKEKNSLIKWIVDQGYTLFIVSWVNPDASYADVGLDTYVEEGFLTAIEQVKEICDVPSVNVVGYCIAGTTLGLTLSLMKQRGDTSVNSATFFTALTDFSDQGEVGVFLSEDFMEGIEREVAEAGVLQSFFMARTFSFLRSNDLIYAPAIRSYMLGQMPPAFDLLFWNGDGTNLPARMAVEYLRGLCQGNQFADGGFDLMGETLNLSDVDVPLCAIACETDHIAAWHSSYAGIRQMGSGDKTFILSESGHIAGIINPPSKKKYGHYTNPDMGQGSDTWKEGAEFHQGSWWPRWEKWLSGRSGKQVAGRKEGGKSHLVLDAAPGTYVK